jgi:hypothetical protein
MRKTEESALWVAYRMTIKGLTQMNAVCKQEEWDTMERDRPGHHTLIRAGIINETDAEKLARSSPVPCDTIKPIALKGAPR